jgi:ParB/RepB/Spo0J family partition protein
MRISDIKVEDRQRSAIDPAQLDELKASIARNGLLHPIVVDRSGRLLAGQRRLEAHKALGLKEIAVTLWEDLPENERKIIELEENLKRSDLDWKDQVKAIRQLHDAYTATQPDWTAARTATALNVTPAFVSRMLTVEQEIKKNPELLRETSAKAIYNQYARRQARDIDAAITDQLMPMGPVAPKAPFELYCADFLSWAIAYDERPFNVLHCDFPYGLSMHDAQMQASRQSDRYDDRPELFFQLLDTLLIARHKLFAPAGHMVFWTAAKHRAAAAGRFRSEPGFVVDEYPLIWHKADLAGIIPDPRRGPRRTYEMALFITWGDRFIVRPVSNSISHPRGASDSEHISEKPLQVVEHFLSMLVDENTDLLDPTCGSGTAIAAAVSLKARRAVGLDSEQKYVDLSHHTVRRRLATDTIIEGIV